MRRGHEEEHRELESGNTLGPYHLDALIGQGGMGLVFRATHEWNGNVVAVKVLKRELTQDEMFKKRFKHEVRASGEIRNRHLVPIVEERRRAWSRTWPTSFCPECGMHSARMPSRPRRPRAERSRSRTALPRLS